MITILALTAISITLAWVSELNSQYIVRRHGRYYLRYDIAFWLLVLVLALFTGLRTEYNDTWNYIYGFRRDGGIRDFLANPENWNPLNNPLFYILQSSIRQFTYNAQVLIFLSSAFTQFCFLLFFKRYSRRFTFTVFLYFTLGTFVFTMAAIKQVLAMAMLTLAVPFLERRQWGRYVLMVVLAALIHTYAIVFLVLPLFRQPPWNSFTFLFVAVTMFVLVNFHSIIGDFLVYVNNMGKALAEYEVLDETTVNLFRVAVYAVPPVLSLVYTQWINFESDPLDHVFIHMSIISLAFISMGTQAGANMFARMASYFELGTLICLPSMLDKTFEKTSFRLVSTIAIFAFAAFFIYANQNFDASFNGPGILGLF